MRKPWSISTTVRNPERLRDFLRVLKELEGQPFKSDTQKKYQILLIQNKLYKPTELTKDEERYYDDIEKEMSFKTAEKIFNTQKYEDPAMRGRNSVAPLNKMGLCVAKNSAKGVKITELGEYFLSEDYDLGKMFFIHLLKWQLPNPDSQTFSEKDGFNIKPFIGTLHLINHVNNLWESEGNKPVGINKEEFSIFALTLIDYKNVNNQARRIVDFRKGLSKLTTDKEKKYFRQEYKKKYAAEFLDSKNLKDINSLIKNLKDYGDNAIRYFRLTRYLYIRGGGYYIDLEPRREIEIKKILETDNAAPRRFADVDQYLEYISDINQPTLPWETQKELAEIYKRLVDEIKQYQDDLNRKKVKIPSIEIKELITLKIIELKEETEKLRAYRRKLQESENHYKSQNINQVEEYIKLLEDIHQSENKKSIELERLTTLALNALNDALEIRPNYPVGDDNEPTFTAPGNKPDIECFYQKFNAVCEVTMLSDRAQWYNEGQPVMRHVRDFEDIHGEKAVYCLFIAPKLHQDTLETFWMAIRYGYKGAHQSIIPLSITQFIKLLKVLVGLKKQGKHFDHKYLQELYSKIINLTDRVAHSEEWAEKIPSTIDKWSQDMLAK